MWSIVMELLFKAYHNCGNKSNFQETLKNTLNSVSEYVNSMKGHNESEDTIFGKLVAARMSSLDKRTKRNMQRKIMEILDMEQ